MIKIVDHVNQYYFLVTYPKQKRVINYFNHPAAINENLYLNIPDILFLIRYTPLTQGFRFEYLSCAFTDENLENFYLPYLPNIDLDGNVCLGRTNTIEAESKEKLTNLVVSRFWNSEFNHGLVAALVMYLELYSAEKQDWVVSNIQLHMLIASFMKNWHQQTKVRPEFLPALKKDYFRFKFNKSDWNFNGEDYS